MNVRANDDSFFSERGSPALLSIKEPALRMLRERYSETFAITFSREKKQIHLFIIKHNMWALVRTFVPKDIPSENIQISDVLTLLENALNGSVDHKSLLSSLDFSVNRAQSRIAAKAEELGITKPK